MVLATQRGSGADGQWTLDPSRVRVALPADEVHVWRASLDRSAEDVAELRALLSVDELARADRFRFERHRARFTVGRGLLRLLLGRHLGLDPAAVRFGYGAYDKPHVERAGVWFNLSHSGAVALMCLACVGEVGIDVELDDADFSRELVAERFFSATEVAVLRSLPEALQPRAFLTCWTRKEAFIKARGDGLSLPLHSFDVTLAPDAPATLVRTAWSREEPRQWRLQDLSDPEAGYIAAVALRSTGWRVVEHRIPETIEGLEPEQEEQ
ncbi:MAG: 4'-phosphopantetheinyl transferase superfamily protein [Actinobacteria bacterium]|nr:4'-phosphopantetheinyl transferase superfamily protein [Actinomycetota bacterium]